MSLRKLIKEEVERISEIAEVHNRMNELFGFLNKAQTDPASMKLDSAKALVNELIKTISKYNELNARYKQFSGIDFAKFYKNLKANMGDKFSPNLMPPK